MGDETGRFGALSDADLRALAERFNEVPGERARFAEVARSLGIDIDPHDHGRSMPIVPEHADALYGWYSPEQAMHVPVLLYEREDGSTVEVTQVTLTATCVEAAWPDLRAVGRVARLIREVRRPRACEPEPAVSKWCEDCWREDESTPDPVPIGERCAKHRAQDEQRWHEVATEGLPPVNDIYFVHYAYPAVGLVERSEWFDGAWREMYRAADTNDLDRDGDKITHWMPDPLPAPPTKEPR